MFSGGLGSYCAARRVVQKHGTAEVTLLFADTRMEDEDLYRFQDDAVRSLGAQFVMLTEGRTPWEVFRDERFLGNSRVDPCSKILKRQICDRWVEENCDPAETVRYVGIDWSEEHRLEKIRKRMAPWVVEAPMCDAPYLSKPMMLDQVRSDGLKPPRLYAMGFDHNNCGGFCVKAGQAAFKNLLLKMPERYAYHEAKEQEIRAFLGKDVSMMTDRRGGKKKPLTMTALRERIEAGLPIDEEEWGGCSCFAGPIEETPS